MPRFSNEQIPFLFPFTHPISIHASPKIDSQYRRDPKFLLYHLSLHLLALDIYFLHTELQYPMILIVLKLQILIEYYRESARYP